MQAFLKAFLLPVVAYPTVLMVGLLLQRSLLDMGMGLQLSSFIPIIVGVSLISLLEFVIPYRKVWRPGFDEVRTDILFTVIVQIVVPRLLGFLVAISLLKFLHTKGVSLSTFWPHNWHVFMQVALMMVSAEFLRYWLHRAAHTWSPLWRLHAVHHSPDKLYWMNTGRFHPLEKVIQFLFDALPFILLGVSAEVLSIYFVVYALNGFFQHSNVNLRMGYLNYVISSAQLHRWHHSRDIGESGTNYGNNLIIWDLVFGSWFLPKDRQVGELGLINRTYPMSFIGQMKTPFTPGIDKYQTMLLSIKEVIQNLQTHMGILLAFFFYRIPFELSLSNPMKYQYRLLKRIIKTNEYTHYGKLHKFSDIHSQSDLVRHIPIQGYEDLRPFISKQELSRQPCLTREHPRYYAVTSGTTGAPKFIPVLNASVEQHRRALGIFASVQNRTRRHTFGGKLLAIPGAYHEGELEGGGIYGSISGLMYFLMPRYLRDKYAVPNEVFSLHDHELKYRLIIRLAIQHANITYMVAANPSTFLKLIGIIYREIDDFADDIEAGTFNAMDALPANVSDAIGGILLCSRERADRLRSLKRRAGAITYANIWPNLQLLVTWTGGSCGIAISSLQELLSDKTGILELGYLSSEFRGSITLEDTGQSGTPTFRDNYFEFIEVDRYEQGDRETLLLDQIKEGRQYQVIITTPAGLYRYFMNDIVEVTGFRKKVPLIRFVQKGKGVTSITGEKLTEHQLIVAVDEVNGEMGVKTPFYLAVARVEDCCYVLYVEASLDSREYSVRVDQKLQDLNTEYQSKRSSGRLNPLRCKCLKPEVGHQYKALGVEKGQRESQFKYLLLQDEADCDFPFDDFLV